LPYEEQIVEVLVEGLSKKDVHKLTGRTRTNKIVNFPGPPALIGDIIPVRVTRAGLYALDGEMIAHATAPSLVSIS
jgi:tRNA-2-methylthio-N6-dimethylallyladenosine synthase